MGAESRSGEWPAEERPPALTDGLFETEEEGGGGSWEKGESERKGYGEKEK